LVWFGLDRARHENTPPRTCGPPYMHSDTRIRSPMSPLTKQLCNSCAALCACLEFDHSTTDAPHEDRRHKQPHSPVQSAPEHQKNRVPEFTTAHRGCALNRVCSVCSSPTHGPPLNSHIQPGMHPRLIHPYPSTGKGCSRSALPILVRLRFSTGTHYRNP